MTIGVMISTILWVVTVMGFVVWNLYQKNKKMESIIETQNYYVQSMSSLSSELDAIVAKMDTTMWVQSDPELVQLFDAVKNINYIIKRSTDANGN